MPSGSLPPGEEAGLPCRSAWYVDTALHQAVTPNADFQFVNIGRWQTAGDFQTATQSPGFRESAARLAGYRPHPDLAGWSALRRLDQGCHQRVSVIITRSAALDSVEGVRPAGCWRAGLI
jgi:hypothetical protein